MSVVKGFLYYPPEPSKCISDIFNITRLFFRSEPGKGQLAFAKDMKEYQSKKVYIS